MSLDAIERVPGTRGYSEAVGRFIELSESVDFERLHSCILDLVPLSPAKILDVGAGSGRDAAAFARLGHKVVAVEPMSEFIDAARRLHPSANIRWVEDSLPRLEQVSSYGCFDFILCHGVWQHLDERARASALSRVSSLLRPGGVFALALRHGPAGQGTYYFPADAEQTMVDAAQCGLELVLIQRGQPSVMANKPNVTWTRLAFRSRTEV